MTGLVLSKAEIAELTRTPIRARQIAFLQKNGIRHYIDEHDRPVVLRSAVESGPTPPSRSDDWRPRKAI